jgi:hypothetical protein
LFLPSHVARTSESLHDDPATFTINVVPLDDPSVLAPRIIGIELVNDRVKITWTSWVRGVYRILTRQKIKDPAWEPTGDEIEAADQVSSAEIPIEPAASARVYAIELVR